MNSKLSENQYNKPRTVITGMGIISALGQGIPVFNNALLANLSQFTQSVRFPNLSFPVISAELNNFDFAEALQQVSNLPETISSSAYKVGRRAPLVIQTSCIAALEAWQQAKISDRNVQSTRIGLVVAGNNITQGYQHPLQTNFQNEPDYLSPAYALHFMDTDQLGSLSEIFGIQGEGFTVGAASASGNVAIIHGQRLIEQGIVDICLVVGVLADLSPMELQGFYNLGALGGQSFKEEPAKACRPFDRNHEGFIWGQASGCLILESSTIAHAAGISVLGEVVSSGCNLDGNRLPDPNVEGEARAMRQALVNAQMTPTDIHYINTHGSSSVLGDKVELAAIHAVFGKRVQQIWLNATKAILGHCLWSAGIVEAIATLLQLNGGFLHGNPNLDNPIDSECRFVSQNYIASDLQVAMSNSFGFGGINTSIILARGKSSVS